MGRTVGCLAGTGGHCARLTEQKKMGKWNINNRKSLLDLSSSSVWLSDRPP